MRRNAKSETCIVTGCNEPRYHTWARCKQHYKEHRALLANQKPPQTCIVEGCNEPRYEHKRLCRAHRGLYQRGLIDANGNPRNQDVAASAAPVVEVAEPAVAPAELQPPTRPVWRKCVVHGEWLEVTPKTFSNGRCVCRHCEGISDPDAQFIGLRVNMSTNRVERVVDSAPMPRTEGELVDHARKFIHLGILATDEVRRG